MEENKLKTVEQPRDRVVLVGLSSPVLKADSADEESMDELAALVETAGAVSVATVLQNLPSPNPRSFIGEGKVAEIKELIGSTEATMAIFDNDLSPSQMRVLTEDLGVQVLDRSGLILDIFAQRAKTKEGRLQVELAQYQYLLPRLIGMWTHLERQAGTSGKGPIGSKGPGETQLETDRRHIHRKIDKLKEDLDEVRRRATMFPWTRGKRSSPKSARTFSATSAAWRPRPRPAPFSTKCGKNTTTRATTAGATSCTRAAWCATATTASRRAPPVSRC